MAVHVQRAASYRPRLPVPVSAARDRSQRGLSRPLLSLSKHFLVAGLSGSHPVSCERHCLAGPGAQSCVTAPEFPPRDTQWEARRAAATAAAQPPAGLRLGFQPRASVMQTGLLPLWGLGALLAPRTELAGLAHLTPERERLP